MLRRSTEETRERREIIAVLAFLSLAFIFVKEGIVL